MTQPIVVTIPHRLGREEALRRVKPALSKASSSFPVLKVDEEVWAGDVMTFRVSALTQIVTGSVNVGDDNLRLELMLPWLLHKFAQAVQQKIESQGRILLENKGRDTNPD